MTSNRTTATATATDRRRRSLDHYDRRDKPVASITTRIGPADHGRRMTLDEFAAADEEPGYRYELARGVLEVSNIPGEPHAIIVCNLYRMIVHFELAHPGVLHWFGGGAEFRFLIPEMDSARHPDAAVVLRATPKGAHGRRPPALAVEVVSRRGEHRDYVAKREEYLAYGLQEYWIADPLAQKLTVLIRQGADWSESVYRGDAPVRSAVLPGVAVTADLLFDDIEPDDDGGDAA